MSIGFNNLPETSRIVRRGRAKSALNKRTDVAVYTYIMCVLFDENKTRRSQ